MICPKINTSPIGRSHASIAFDIAKYSSFPFFQAAEEHLKNETGEITLSSIQARLLQCYYLLSRARINQCYSIFGTVVNLVHVTGLHRKQDREHTSNRDLIIFECRKRVFWSAHILDKYLSSALGRPQKFHEEDIDQVGSALLKTSDAYGD